MKAKVVAMLLAGGALLASWYWYCLEYFPSHRVLAGGYEVSLFQPLADYLRYLWVIAPIAIVALFVWWRKPSRPIAAVAASAFTVAWLIAGTRVPLYWQDDQILSWYVLPTTGDDNKPAYSLGSSDHGAPPTFELLSIEEYSARLPDTKNWVLRPTVARRTFNVYGEPIGYQLRYEPEWMPSFAHRLSEGYRIPSW